MTAERLITGIPILVLSAVSLIVYLLMGDREAIPIHWGPNWTPTQFAPTWVALGFAPVLGAIILPAALINHRSTNEEARQRDLVVIGMILVCSQGFYLYLLGGWFGILPV